MPEAAGFATTMNGAGAPQKGDFERDLACIAACDSWQQELLHARIAVRAIWPSQTLSPLRIAIPRLYFCCRSHTILTKRITK